MSALRDQVSEFHRAFDIPIVSYPKVPPDDRARLKLRLIAEEFFELLEAVFGNCGEFGPAAALVGDVIRGRRLRVDFAKFADALGDLDYVVEGCRLEFGVDGDPIARIIHQANMAKVGGETRGDGKVMKPKQWQPPDIAGELRRQRAAVLGPETHCMRRDGVPIGDCSGPGNCSCECNTCCCPICGENPCGCER